MPEPAGLCGQTPDLRPPFAVVILVAVGGAIYLGLWIYGLIFTGDIAANFIPVITADNWLHFGLGVVMIAVGVLLMRTPDRREGGLPG